MRYPNRAELGPVSSCPCEFLGRLRPGRGLLLVLITVVRVLHTPWANSSPSESLYWLPHMSWHVHMCTELELWTLVDKQTVRNEVITELWTLVDQQTVRNEDITVSKQLAATEVSNWPPCSCSTCAHALCTHLNMKYVRDHDDTCIMIGQAI